MNVFEKSQIEKKHYEMLRLEDDNGDYIYYNDLVRKDKIKAIKDIYADALYQVKSDLIYNEKNPYRKKRLQEVLEFLRERRDQRLKEEGCIMEKREEPKPIFSV